VLGGTGSITGDPRPGCLSAGPAGIKPTYGLISGRGIPPLAFSLDHAGPLAWTVEDKEILLQTIAGQIPGNSRGSGPLSASKKPPKLDRDEADDS
jgi:aspartyl-tRNA(Asn)/glutamyl-tRNA(Gln) amidotransferase subunit A